MNVPVEWENSIGMKFVLIPPGEFMMGTPQGEISEAEIKEAVADQYTEWDGWIRSESPQHKVIISVPFYLGMHEVRQADFERVMLTNPSFFNPKKVTSGPKSRFDGLTIDAHPVEGVSWNDAAEFCAALSKTESFKPRYFRSENEVTFLDGDGYRLPTEAEWEFSCRAGTTTKYWTGDTRESVQQAGWSNKNSGGRTHAVGELKANPFGLFDIVGNVWEWTQDVMKEDYYSQVASGTIVNPTGPEHGPLRVSRGGDSYWPVYRLRSATRTAIPQTTANDIIGIRASLGVDAVRQALGVRGPAVPKQPPEVNAPGVNSPRISWHGWPVDAPKPAIAPFTATEARAYQDAWAEYLKVPREWENSIGMKFVLIPPGEFMMGSTDEQAEDLRKQFPPVDDKALMLLAELKAEQPCHAVTLTRPFSMGVTEVTVGEFRAFVEAEKYQTEAERDRFKGRGYTWKSPGYPDYNQTNLPNDKNIPESFPVTYVTWTDAVTFCNWLSKQEGIRPCYESADRSELELVHSKGFRLPTEAEWEFACRAGTTDHWWFGNDLSQLTNHAWFGENTAHRNPSSVGEKLPNPFGLFDMYGNACEWCQDSASPNYESDSSTINPIQKRAAVSRIHRGGDWFYVPFLCRSAHRGSYTFGAQTNAHGFRVVRGW